MVIHPETFNDIGNQGKTWTGMIVLSILFHSLFFSGVLFFPELNFRNNDLSSLVEIDLVSLPPAASTPPRKAPSKIEPVPEKKKAAPPVPKRVEPARTTEAVSLSPTKPVQVKRSLKKKTFNVSKAINKAIANLEKKAPESRPQSVLQAIDALKKKQQESPESNAVGSGAGIGEKTKKHLELLDIYNAEIWGRIKKNWAFSKEMTGSRDRLEAIVNIRIMRDGQIRDVYFDTKAGVRLFDESVLKAVQKSNPLPPLPEGFLRPYYDVGLRFNSAEL